MAAASVIIGAQSVWPQALGKTTNCVRLGLESVAAPEAAAGSRDERSGP